MEILMAKAVENSLWAGMFVALFIYVLKQNAAREKKYTDLIEKFASIIDVKLEVLEKTLCEFIGRKKHDSK